MPRNSMLVAAVVVSALVAAAWFARSAQAQAGPITPLPLSCDGRIPILALPFQITRPGSYYLRGNLRGVPGSSGISVEADDVTIDLNGFTLRGVSGGSGIHVPTAHHNLAVLNGTVRDWKGDGIDAALAVGGRFEHLQCVNNGDNTAATGVGLRAGVASRISDCSSRDNHGGGIVVGDSSIIRQCAAYNNVDAMSMSNGFVIGGDCTIVDSTAEENSASGIVLVGTGNSVSGCTASINVADGIRVQSGSNLIHGNVCRNNGSTAGGAGIHVLAGAPTNRLDSNHLEANAFGIKVDTSDNLIVRNSAKTNATMNYSFVAGNDAGPIGTAALSTSPWSNIEY